MAKINNEIMWHGIEIIIKEAAAARKKKCQSSMACNQMKKIMLYSKWTKPVSKANS